MAVLVLSEASRQHSTSKTLGANESVSLHLAKMFPTELGRRREVPPPVIFNDIQLPGLVHPDPYGMSFFIQASSFRGTFFILVLDPPDAHNSNFPHPSVYDDRFEGHLMLLDIDEGYQRKRHWIGKPTEHSEIHAGTQGFWFEVRVAGHKVEIVVCGQWLVFSGDYKGNPFRNLQVSTNLQVHTPLAVPQHIIRNLVLENELVPSLPGMSFVIEASSFRGKFFILVLDPPEVPNSNFPHPSVYDDRFEGHLMLLDIDEGSQRKQHWIEKPTEHSEVHAGMSDFRLEVRVAGHKVEIVVCGKWLVFSGDYKGNPFRHLQVSTNLQVRTPLGAPQHIIKKAAPAPTTTGDVSSPEPVTTPTETDPTLAKDPTGYWHTIATFASWSAALLLLIGAFYLLRCTLTSVGAQERRPICVLCSVCGRRIEGFTNEQRKVYIGPMGGRLCGEYRNLEDVWRAYGPDDARGELVHCNACDQARLNGEDCQDPDALFDAGLAELAGPRSAHRPF